MADPKVFLALEASLAKRLKKNWSKIAKPVAKRMATAFKDRDPDKAIKELHTLNMARVFKGEQKYLKYITASAQLFGAGNATDVASSATADGAGAATQKNSIKQFKSLVTDITNTVIKKGIRVAAALDVLNSRIADRVRVQKDEEESLEIDDGSAAAVSQSTPANPLKGDAKWLWDQLFPEGISIEDVDLEDISERLRVVLPTLLEKAGDDLIDIAASLHTSRLASYGFLLEAELMGASTYRVNEQLDGRTCEVCKIMHGTEFKVRTNLLRQDELLNIKDMAELKEKAPWPKQDARSLLKLEKMSADEMQAAGYSTPPYHPLCRGILLYDAE